MTSSQNCMQLDRWVDLRVLLVTMESDIGNIFMIQHNYYPCRSVFVTLALICTIHHVNQFSAHFKACCFWKPFCLHLMGVFHCLPFLVHRCGHFLACYPHNCTSTWWLVARA